MILPIFEPPPGRSFPDWMPALLGRDVIRTFALHLDDFMDRVLFLDRAEADSLDLP